MFLKFGRSKVIRTPAQEQDAMREDVAAEELRAVIRESCAEVVKLFRQGRNANSIKFWYVFNGEKSERTGLWLIYDAFVEQYPQHRTAITENGDLVISEKYAETFKVVNIGLLDINQGILLKQSLDHTRAMLQLKS